MTSLAFVVALASAQLSDLTQSSQFDDAQVVGRVCDDLDGNGVCGADEPGVPEARVLTETGLEAVTDAHGRFHFAGLGARTTDFTRGRLLPGRHRFKLDPTSLVGAWAGADQGRTVELSAGSAAWVPFALRRGERAPVRLDEGPPIFRKGETTLEYLLAVTAGQGDRVRIAGSPSPDRRGWVSLSPGLSWVPVTVSTQGVTRVFVQPFDVVTRKASVLVVPRALRPIATVSISADGRVSIERDAASAMARISLGDVPLEFAPSGRASLKLGEGAVKLSVELEGITFVEELERPDAATFFASGLLDLEANYDFRQGVFGVTGRGAAAARATLAGFKLGAELDLRDTDFNALVARTLIEPHRIDVFQRQLDPQRSPLSWADDSATVASNPSEGRFRVQLEREGWGRAGYGSTRWFQSSGEIGRAHRAVQGAFLDLQTPTKDFGVGVKGFVAPNQIDSVAGLARRPMHERFESTGGSLFFLSKTPVVTGSEAVRIEWRDAVSQLPLGERHLTRLKDYTIDPFSGRVLLNQPLSSFAMPGVLQADPLTGGVVQQLFVDYEFLDTSGGAFTFGGELNGRLGPVTLLASGFRDGAYSLFRGGAKAALGPVLLSAEAAYSLGAIEGLSFSRDGGLTSAQPTSLTSGSGFAATVRARTKGLFGRGFWDAAWRWRQDGFQDTGGVGALQQISVRGEQPLGPVIVSALVDFRDMVDPRSPYSPVRLTGRTIGGGVGYESERWGVRLEGREFQQTQLGETNGGFTLGLAGRVRLTNWLQLRAGYRQQLFRTGGVDLTFGSLGVDVKPTEKLELGVRGGWGPGLGPQVWGTASYVSGNETWYGVQSNDVDAPGTGERRLVTGVRQQLDPDTAVFAEDVSATDVDGLRLGRAVGLTQRVAEGFTVSARYEHGARALDGLAPDVSRNAGGLTLSFEQDALRLFARGEVRDETGARVVRQYVASGGGEWRPLRDVSLTARALWTHSAREGQMVGRTVDATLSAAWRFGSGAVIARYAWTQNWSPVLESRQHVVSLLPTFRLGDRFALGAGGHLGFTELGPVLAGSLRPSVRIWEGLEVAAEGAARTLNIGGSSWASLRGEVGYRFDHRFFFGVGFNAFGFSGTGLDAGATSSRDRVYLRAEVAY